jgi:hypothetical protein
MRSDVLFVSVILPICVVIWGLAISYFHNRWLDREIANERAGAEREKRLP